MALQDILATIRTESEETAAQLIAEARAEEDRMLSRGREEADEEERRLAGSEDDRIRSERARALSQSHLEAARGRRMAREQVYARAIAGVTRRLSAIRASAEYEPLMASLLEEAVAALPGATSVRVDPDDAEVMRRVLESKGVSLGVETEPTPLGGLVLVAPGTMVDNRLATRLERADDQLRFVAGDVIPELRGAPE